MNKFKQSTAVITGAGSGIGRQLAIQLAQHGANVAISDVNVEGLAETAKLIAHLPTQVRQDKLDVSDKEAVFNYAQDLESDFGEINLVINNAGVGLSTGTFANTSIEEFEWLMSINFSGVLYGSKAFLPILHKAEWGHIVNISSLFGLMGVPGQSAYNASKFGVRGLTEALRQELDITSPTVSCTSVHPGGVKTNIARNSRTPDKHIEQNEIFLGDPDDFDKLARTTADSAATQIIKAVEKNKRRLLIGADAKFLDWVQRHFPNGYHRVLMTLKNFLQS